MNQELEPQQYYPLYQEEDVPLIDVRKSALRKLVWGTILILFAFMVLGFTIRFPNEINLPFVLKSDQPETIYQFSHTVFLLERMVSEQEKVAVGQPLVKITSPEIVEMVTNISSNQSELNYHIGQTDLTIRKEKEILKSQMKSLKLNRERQKQERTLLKTALESEITTLTAKMEHAKKQYQIYKQLYQSGTEAQIEMEEKHQTLITTTNQLKQARNQYQKEFSELSFGIMGSREKQKELARKSQKLAIEYDNKTVAIEEQIRLAKSKLAQNYGNYEIVKGGILLKANTKGIISFLFPGDKEVPASTTLLKNK